jgi:hypothetical protein
MEKYVWFQKSTGKFSDSWDENTWGHNLDDLCRLGDRSEGDWTLIRYEVLTEADFEFCHLMRIA